MDADLLQLINRSLARPRLDDLMLMLSAAALVVLPGLGLWLLLQRRHRRLALVLLGAVVTTLALTLLLQHAVGRPRPEGVRLLIPTPTLSGFPSGHASLVWCAAVLLGLACRRPGPWLGGVLAASVVCLSRIYLGHHYPTDVLGGALLGAGVGAAFFGVWIDAPRHPRPAGRLRWLLWPELALMALITELAYLGLLPRGWTHGVPYADKWLHFTFYGLLAFLLHLWLDGRRVTRLRVALAPLIVIVAASVEETAQLLSSRRTADVTDLLCDVCGVVLFVWLGERLLRRGTQVAPIPQLDPSATSSR